MVDIRLASEIPQFDIVADSAEPKNLVTPGSLITKETGFMRFVFTLTLFLILLMGNLSFSLF